MFRACYFIQKVHCDMHRRFFNFSSISQGQRFRCRATSQLDLEGHCIIPKARNSPHLDFPFQGWLMDVSSNQIQVKKSRFMIPSLLELAHALVQIDLHSSNILTSPHERLAAPTFHDIRKALLFTGSQFSYNSGAVQPSLRMFVDGFMGF